MTARSEVRFPIDDGRGKVFQPNHLGACEPREDGRRRKPDGDHGGAEQRSVPLRSG